MFDCESLGWFGTVIGNGRADAQSGYARTANHRCFAVSRLLTSLRGSFCAAAISRTEVSQWVIGVILALWPDVGYYPNIVWPMPLSTQKRAR